MNFENILIDIKLLIFDYLTYKSLRQLSLTCQIFNNLINNDLLEKRKNRGYPRDTSECKIHDISKYPFETHLTLLDIDDLVRGDLLKYYVEYKNNEGTYIFDGCKIIKLDCSLNNCAHLPKQFLVITNNVPLNYWYNKIGYYFSVYHPTVKDDYINLINIDITLLRDQCLNNLKHDGKLIFPHFCNRQHYEELLYTYFEFNNIKYHIIIPGSYSKICQEDIDEFTNYINNNDISQFDIDRIDPEDGQNILYFGIGEYCLDIY